MHLFIYGFFFEYRKVPSLPDLFAFPMCLRQPWKHVQTHIFQCLECAGYVSLNNFKPPFQLQDGLSNQATEYTCNTHTMLHTKQLENQADHCQPGQWVPITFYHYNFGVVS